VGSPMNITPIAVDVYAGSNEKTTMYQVLCLLLSILPFFKCVF